MRVLGFMTSNGTMMAMVEGTGEGLTPIPVKDIQGNVKKGTQLSKDTSTGVYFVVGEAECEACGIDRVGGE